MLKLNSKIHGVIDYVVVIFLWLSPTLFGLPKATSLFNYVLGGIHFLLTLTTNFELGLIKRIPLKIHGLIELIVSLVLVVVALFLGSLEGDASKRFYLFFASAIFITWILTDYHSYQEKQ